MRENGHGLLPALALALAACATPPQAPPPAPLPTAGNVRIANADAPLPSDMPEILAQIKTAYHDGNYDRGLALVKRALELKQADVSTFDRLGSVYYALGRSGEALAMWDRALPLERDLGRRRRLREAIAMTRRGLGLVDEQAAPPPAETTAPETAPSPIEREAQAAPNPRQIRELYNQGVKHYASGEYLEATTAFMRVLELDPGNEDATKALERLRLEPGAAP